jgi:hypothetical protein
MSVPSRAYPSLENHKLSIALYKQMRELLELRDAVSRLENERGDGAFRQGAQALASSAIRALPTSGRQVREAHIQSRETGRLHPHPRNRESGDLK